MLAMLLATVTLSCLLIAPGIVYGVYWIFASDAAALRSTSGWEALTYSQALVEGRWRSAFNRIVGLAFVLMFPVAAVGAMLEYLPFFGSDVWVLRMAASITKGIAYVPYGVSSILFFLNMDHVRPSSEAPGTPGSNAPA